MEEGVDRFSELESGSSSLDERNAYLSLRIENADKEDGITPFSYVADLTKGL